MSMLKRIVGAALAITMVSSSALAAEAIRPASLLAATSIQPVSVRSGARLGSPVDHKNSLLGAPLLLAFLGAVAVTIGTIVIANNNDSPSSPG